MNLRGRSWVIGALLLVALFSYSALPILRRTVQPEDGTREVLRIAHRQLNPGMRRGYETVARRYEELNPSVRIEYLDVPPATFLMWLTTQFTGGTATDIVEVIVEMTDENVARNFLPLGALVEQPNPYNRGTPLEGVPWRDTFVDGMATRPAYREAQLEVFGVPTSMVTSRYYYNKTLYLEATGRTAPPRDYDELLTVCREIEEWATRNRRVVMPLSGSRRVYLLLASRVFGQQTQRMALERGDPLGVLRPSAYDLHLWMAQDPAALHAKPLVTGFTILHELGRFMPPGFLGVDGAEVLFNFGQSRAVIMMGGSNIYGPLLEQVSFDVGVFALPLPGPDHPRHGGNARGELTEIEQNAGAALGVTRFARNPERAWDFLQFLSAVSTNLEFSQSSQMLPVIVGVPPHEDIAEFAPREGGYPYGFNINVGGAHDRRDRLIFSQLHLLFGPGGSPEAFVAATAEPYHREAREDLLRAIRDTRRSLARQDTLHAALDQLARDDSPEAKAARGKQLGLEERTTQQEFLATWAAVKMDAP